MNVLDTIKNNYYALHGEFPKTFDCEVVPLNGISQEIAETYTDPALVKKHLAQWKKDLKARDLKLGDIVTLSKVRPPSYSASTPCVIVNIPSNTDEDSVYVKDLSGGRYIEVCYLSDRTNLPTTYWVEPHKLRTKTFTLEEVLPIIEWRDMQLKIREKLNQGGQVELINQDGSTQEVELLHGYNKSIIYSSVASKLGDGFHTTRWRLP
jgi:hypothetical protein